MWDPTWDGEPAFGRATNLRLTEDGAVVVADLVGLPDWLTETDSGGVRRIASAYPSRSCEPLFDWTTAGQRHYRMVIVAVALLGEFWPACQDIDDLELMLTEGPAAMAAAQAGTPGRVARATPRAGHLARLALTREGIHPVTQMINLYIDGKRLAARVAALSGPTPARPAALSVSVDLVQTLFNWEWAFAEHPDGVDRWSWWARDIRLDPAEVIASDGEGGTWRVPFTTDGQSTITFQAPERVREDYVPSEPPEAVSAFALHGADRPPTKTGNRLMAAARAEGAISYLRRTLNASPTPAASRPPTNQEGST
jgi:hypothetical protein